MVSGSPAAGTGPPSASDSGAAIRGPCVKTSMGVSPTSDVDAPRRGAIGRPEDGPSTLASTLGHSVRRDLMRFADEPGGADLLSAVTACVRHARALALHAEHGGARIRISVYPREQLFHSTIDVCALSPGETFHLRLIHVEPEVGSVHLGADSLATHVSKFGTLNPLLWQLAMHGSRTALLPELSGAVRFRLTPGFSAQGLPIESSLRSVLYKLRDRSSSLEDLAGQTVLGQVRVRRLLNATYLQSGLIVTRGSPTSRGPWAGLWT